jgi:hypothetical protein
MVEYRLYCFVNTFLSPIQKGLQSAHVISELLHIYWDGDPVRQWVVKDKTIIILDGGSSQRLLDIEQIVKKTPIFYSMFREPMLNDSVTAIGMILPDRIWRKDKWEVRETATCCQKQSEIDLMRLIDNGKLSS